MRRRPRAARLLALLLPLAACGTGYDLQRGREALDASRLPDAERAFRRVLDREPDEPEALLGLGWVYLQGGQLRLARDYFRRCQRVVPADARCIRGLGAVALASGRPREARAHLERALALAPEDPAILNSVALVALSEERYEEALGLLDRAAARWTGGGELQANRAEALFRLGRYEEALRAVDAGLGAGTTRPRFRALLLELRARTLVALTGHRFDPEDCEGTAPPLLELLDQAEAAVRQARAVEVDLPTLDAAARLVARRRAAILERCPPGDG